MPPRLNKRQLRELEELQALEASSHGEQVDREESEQEDVQVHKAPTGFTAVSLTADFTASTSLITSIVNVCRWRGHPK